jgi:hypothetical protein
LNFRRVEAECIEYLFMLLRCHLNGNDHVSDNPCNHHSQQSKIDCVQTKTTKTDGLVTKLSRELLNLEKTDRENSTESIYIYT